MSGNHRQTAVSAEATIMRAGLHCGRAHRTGVTFTVTFTAIRTGVTPAAARQRSAVRGSVQRSVRRAGLGVPGTS